MRYGLLSDFTAAEVCLGWRAQSLIQGVLDDTSMGEFLLL
jgi:hypothetical protein